MMMIINTFLTANCINNITIKYSTLYTLISACMCVWHKIRHIAMNKCVCVCVCPLVCVCVRVDIVHAYQYTNMYIYSMILLDSSHAVHTHAGIEHLPRHSRPGPSGREARDRPANPTPRRLPPAPW